MKKFFKEFKAFISRGNIIDMAVGVIIGGAFSAIVTALTNKIIMPLINALLAMGGGGLESARTIIGEAAYLEGGAVDWTNTIYIDWGAFITAVIDFFLIALVLFIILKAVMGAQGFVTKTVKDNPTKEEKKQLKEQGVDMKDRKAVLLATADLRAAKKAEEEAKAKAEEEAKVTTEKLLMEIRDMMKAKEEVKPVKEPAKTKAKKTTK